MHPIEHLRYVARSRGVDPSELAREAAVALGSMRSDPSALVLACRRLVERHPEVGPLWWLCSRLLMADDPSGLAWELADEIEADPTPRSLAAALPDEATVLTIGWPQIAGAGLMRRGDCRVLCADSRFEASAFMQRLERVDVACEPVTSESIGRAAAVADLVIVEAVVANPSRVLAPIGSLVLAATAASVGVPVWCVVGRGRRLPLEYVDAIAGLAGVGSDDWEIEIDDLPVALIDIVVSADASGSDVAVQLAAECVLTPELLRSSPI